MSETNFGDKRLKRLEQMVERDKKFTKIRINGEDDIADLMDVPEVKSCPFCGGNVVKVLAADMVVCLNDDCRGAGPISDSTKGAFEKWNTRPWVKHLEHMIESHMNVIDKLNARIKLSDECLADFMDRLVANERTIDDLRKQLVKIYTQVRKVETWHSGGGIWLDIITLENGQVLVISDELVSIWKDLDEFVEDTGGKNNNLSRITTEIVLPHTTDECEHMWRVSPYDAGLTFCCLCGIEHS